MCGGETILRPPGAERTFVSRGADGGSVGRNIIFVIFSRKPEDFDVIINVFLNNVKEKKTFSP